MHVVITLCPAGDRVIVASDLPVLDVLETCRRCRGIEPAFSSLKGCGLNPACGTEDVSLSVPFRGAQA